MGRWRRVGDLAKTSMLLDKKHNGSDFFNTVRKVSFVADSVSAIICRIDIVVNEYDISVSHDKISLSISPFYNKEVIAACEYFSIPYTCSDDTFEQFCDSRMSFKLFDYPKKTLNANIYIVNLILNLDNLSLVLRLFQYFNKEIQPTPFPDELFSELNQISQYIVNQLLEPGEMSLSCHKHIIASKSNELPQYYQHGNIALEVISGQHYTNSPISTCQNDIFKTALLSGVDPDLQDSSGFSALTYAMLAQPSVWQMELLLCYEANPFERPSVNGGCGKYSLSPYELAFAFGMQGRANIIVDEFCWLTRRTLELRRSNTSLKVSESSSVWMDNSIISYFHFNDQSSINTRMIPVSRLNTEAEKETRFVIAALFKENFQALNDTSGDKLTKIFDKDFSGDKYIDIIYHAGKIIGFNLLEIIHPPQNKNIIFVHSVYGVIKPEYRGNGLMTFLSFRLAYIIQLMMPEKRIGVVVSCIHFNGYRLVDFEHFPKYQSDAIKLLVKQLLDAIYGSNYQYYHHLITSYVVEDIRVRTSEKSDHVPSLNERFYTNEILGFTNLQKNGESRSTPVSYLVGEDNYLHIRKVAHELNIDFESHIAEYARLFNLFMDRSKRQHGELALKFSVFMRPGGSLLNATQNNKGVIQINKTMTKL